MKLVMESFPKFFLQLLSYFLICCCFFTIAKSTYADSNDNIPNQQREIKRSLESLRDLDYQTWQVIVYPSSTVTKNLTLRIVGFPGSLRFDHPTSLLVNSGRKNWELKDITRKRKVEFETLNDSAAEFDLGPLIADLDKNRPLRLSLPGLINDLPIPPYLVSEWRTLVQKND
tara:strand:- start:1015 stop:1530 length:516 start_codon:yes stop_codon:yes gene_type:complete